MARVVVDANQALKLATPLNAAKLRAVPAGIALPAYVLAEILLRTDPGPTLAALRNFGDMRLGLQLVDVMEIVAGLGERGIVNFEPFAILGTSTEYDTLAEALNGPSQLHIDWARKIKEKNLEFCGRLFQLSVTQLSVTFRKRVQECGLDKQKYKDMKKALSEHGVRSTSFLGSLVVSSISNDSQRPLTVREPKVFYETIMCNQYLARFFKTILYYTLSFARVWENQTHNFDPTSTRDDWTDITVPLYAANGDIVLTADKKLQSAIRMIDPCGTVVAKSIDYL